MIKGQSEIRDAYRDGLIAQTYIGERFQEPLGELLHRQQTAALKHALARYRPSHVLEIAPGPARLSVELISDLSSGATVVDTSFEMLKLARERLRQGRGSSWRLVQGDAFALPLRPVFDFVYSFRLVRHFDAVDRLRLFREIHRVMRPGGLLLFDAVNRLVAEPFRARSAPLQHYDAVHSEQGLVGELAQGGFRNPMLTGVQRRHGILYEFQVLVAPRSKPLARLLMHALQGLPGGSPMEWVVQCQRG